MLATDTIGFVSCQKQISSANTTSTAKENKDEKDDEKLRSRKDELKYYERILCLGLLNVSINPTFKNIALQLTAQHHLQDTAVNDYYTTFSQLNTACQNAGFNMIQAMKNSVIANGGTTTDANNLQDIVLGFKVKGIDLEPGLRLSYRDGLVPNLDNVHRVTCRQLYKQDAIPAWTLNPATGIYQESIVSKTLLDQSPTWTVNILRVNNNRSIYLYTAYPGIISSDDRRCRTDRPTGAFCDVMFTEKRCRCGSGLPFPSLVNSL